MLQPIRMIPVLFQKKASKTQFSGHITLRQGMVSTNFREKITPDPIDILIHSLNDHLVSGNTSDHQAAFSTLCALPDHEKATVLTTLAKVPDNRIRLALAKVFPSLSWQLKEKHQPQIIQFWTDWLTAALPNWRKSAVKALGKTPDADKISILQTLSAHENPMIRGGVAKAARSIQLPYLPQRDALISQLTQDLNLYVRAEAVKGLPLISDKQLQKTLIDRLKPYVEDDKEKPSPNFSDQRFIKALSEAIKACGDPSTQLSKIQTTLANLQQRLNNLTHPAS